MMTIMTTRLLPNYNQQEMIYQTKIQQLFVTIGMLDEFYRTLVSLLSFFNPSRTMFHIQFAIRFYYKVTTLDKKNHTSTMYLLTNKWNGRTTILQYGII
jgi:hypothetical protein